MSARNRPRVSASCPLCACNTALFQFSAWNPLEPGSDVEYPVVRCTRCGLVYPQNLTEDTKGNTDVQSVPFYFSGKGNIRHMLKRISALRPGSLLDVGCGNGDFMKAAADRGWDVTGVESGAATNPHGLPIFHGPFETVDLPGKRFDLITFWGVTEYVKDPRAFFKRAHDLLKPKGHIMFVSSNYDSVQRRIMKTHSFPRQRACWSLPAIRYVLNAASFTIEHLDDRNDIRNGWCTELVVFAFKRVFQRKSHRHILEEHSRPGPIPFYLLPVKLLDRIITLPLSLLLQLAGHNGVITVTAVKKAS